MPPTTGQLTREDLYSQVWAEPMRTVAKRLDISDVGLAKHCRKMNIPVPGRGYWAKKAAGQKVKLIPLPKLPPHDSVTPRSMALRPPPPPPIEPPSVPQPVAEQMAFEADAKNAIAVADSLRSPHPLVRSTMLALEGTGKKELEYLSNWQMRHLDVEVTKGSLRRALRVADALLKAFEHRGWKVSLGTSSERDDRKTWVAVLGQRIPFGIREPLKKVLNEPAQPRRLPDGQWYTPHQSKYRDEPSGKLALVLRNSWGHSVSRSWPDLASQPIEERLSEFVIAIVAQAHELNERDARFAEEERKRRAAEEVRAAEQRRREAEIARREALSKQATSWDQCRLLNEYICSVRAAAESQAGSAEPDAEVREWIAWAEAYASALNPLARPLIELAREREKSRRTKGSGDPLHAHERQPSGPGRQPD